ncbi:tyrosine-type recombinase/integrase [Elusimicrobiota bacterium]
MSGADLKEALRGFLGSYLIEQRQFSPHTLKSYRDTFKLLLQFTRREKGASKSLKLSDLDVPLILNFLKHLEDDEGGRGNLASTRNYRLAAIRSFFKYLSWQYPGLERQAKRIRAIPTKKSSAAKLDFLTKEELKLVFGQIDTQKPDGFRDLAMFTYLYNTGARSQEVADTRISWLDFASQTVFITGKGNKERVVPLWATTIKAIETYLNQYRRRPRLPGQDFLFINQRGGGFTRFGIRCIVKKYLQRAETRYASLRSKKLSAHSMRHTCAMDLLKSGVELNVIKAWLGHKDLKTTFKYLEADSSQKKEALARFGPPIYVTSSLEQKTHSSTEQILDWLKDL